MSPRTYQSPRRESAAASTRAAILEAALALFEGNGYAATTIASVAAQADVSVNTVYASVGGKPQLLVELIAEAASDARIEKAMAKARAATTGRGVLQALASGTRDSFRSHDWLLGALYDNTGADPVLAKAAASAERAYAARLAEAAGCIEILGDLRPGVTVIEASDALWFYFGIRPWKDLRSRGWSWQRCETWLIEQSVRAILGADA